jgi:hypothetical protein
MDNQQEKDDRENNIPKEKRKQGDAGSSGYFGNRIFWKYLRQV